MKKKIRELVDENFAAKEFFDDNEEDFTVGSSLNLLDDKIEEFPTDVRNGLFVFKSQVFPGDRVSEPAAKRAKIVSEGKDFFDSPSEYESSNEDPNSDIDGDDDDDIDDQKHSDTELKQRKSFSAADDFGSPDDSDIDVNKDDEEYSEAEPMDVKSSEAASDLDSPDDSDIGESDVQDEDGEDGSDDDDDGDDDDAEEEQASSNIDESDIEDDLNETEVGDLSGVFSKKILDESSELEKAKAVTNQLALWDNLIESRILLQKCIAETNELPHDHASTQPSPEKKNSIENLEKFLAKLIEFQEKLRRVSTKQDDISEEEYANFRDKTIETWYNKTRGARTNFSAFETPLLKQIEKADLVKKTYLNLNNEPSENEDESTPAARPDTQTIADDDYYHKLLRHYIRKKTANISDSTQLGRQWMKLQTLRSKMKRKIDTRKTKGRKIKFDPHSKLMNFMAPQRLRKWEDESINELYSSLFGKKTLNSL